MFCLQDNVLPRERELANHSSKNDEICVSARLGRKFGGWAYDDVDFSASLLWKLLPYYVRA